VRVRLAQTDDARTRVHVTYDITSLDESADTRLEEFAAGYDAMMREWELLIADALPRIAALGAD
jgi:hypothetical protein